MALVQFVTKVEMDDQTIDELHTLRSIRIEMTRSLLDNLDKTLNDLVEVGTITQDEVTEEYRENLKAILLDKLNMLTDRCSHNHFFDDELAFFSDIEVSNAEDLL